MIRRIGLAKRARNPEPASRLSPVAKPYWDGNVALHRALVVEKRRAAAVQVPLPPMLLGVMAVRCISGCFDCYRYGEHHRQVEVKLPVKGDAPGAGNEDARRLHEVLVQRLISGGHLSDPWIAAAFRAVPRHLFLPDVPLETVYSDEAIGTKTRDGLALSSSSQPTVMAVMLDQLDLEPGMRVLEIGAGTGYNAALMAHLVGSAGQVVTVDIDEDIVEGARSHLHAAGFENVQVIRGDGAAGYTHLASYDRIILTVAAWDIAPAWIEQLRSGGRLVLPLALNGFVQKLVAFERCGDRLESVSVRDGSFMPLRGSLAGPAVHVPLGPAPGVVLSLGESRPIDAGEVYALLNGQHSDLPTPFEVTRDRLWGGFGLWLALHAPTMCGLVATGAAAERGILPSPFIASSKFRVTAGLLESGELCLLASESDNVSAVNPAWVALAIRRFGADDGASQHLLRLLEDWDRAERPSTQGLQIRAVPRDSLSAIPEGAVQIEKRETRLFLQWT